MGKQERRRTRCPVPSESRRAPSPAAVVLVALGLACGPFLQSEARAQAVYFVDAANACPGSGTSLDPFCRIQPAIDVGFTFDVIRVAGGTYVENLDFGGRILELVGDGADQVRVEGAVAGQPVLALDDGEGLGTRVAGITLANGDAPFGACLLLRGSHALIEELAFEDCFATTDGGGIHVEDGGPELRRLSFLRCGAAGNGGGLNAVGSGSLVLGESRLVDSYSQAGVGGGSAHDHACFELDDALGDGAGLTIDDGPLPVPMDCS